MSGTVPVPSPPVYPPLRGWPAAFVPVAVQGLRTWDRDGPSQVPLPR